MDKTDLTKEYILQNDNRPIAYYKRWPFGKVHKVRVNCMCNVYFFIFDWSEYIIEFPNGKLKQVKDKHLMLVK